MWKTILNFVKALFSTQSTSCGVYTKENFQWHIPQQDKWPFLEVFTATGLCIGKGVVEISTHCRRVVVDCVYDHHFKDGNFRINNYVGYAVPMVSLDYSRTKAICIFDTAKPVITEKGIDATHELEKRWQFAPEDLYWEHPGNGLVPFFSPE